MPLDERRLLLNGLQPHRRSPSLSDGTKPQKRPRTDGLNARYDRMIQTVNIMHGSLSTSRRSRRERGPSSSSVMSYGVPRIPVGAYSGLCTRRLGQEFSALQMKGPRSSMGHSNVFAPDALPAPVQHAAGHAEELPAWLQGTLESLDSKHPLRLLVPGQPTSPGDSSPSALDSSSDLLATPGPEERSVSFVPSANSRPKGSETLACSMTIRDRLGDGLSLQFYAEDSNSTSQASATALVTGLAAYDDPRALGSPGVPLRPFSTPGPASSVRIPSSVQSGRSFPLAHEARPPTGQYPPFCDSPMEDSLLPPNFVPFSEPGPLGSPRLQNVDRSSDIFGTAPNVNMSDSALSLPSSTSRLLLLRDPSSPGVLGHAPSCASSATRTTVTPLAACTGPDPRGLLSPTLEFEPFAAPGPTVRLFSPAVAAPVEIFPVPPPVELRSVEQGFIFSRPECSRL
ncbi:hypothetical protein BD414DRAFT_500549 [Trametes punicea]|nr:hypothetical protein BD414DRAFT_500549 [Trametes punicea]